jgi:hypothetical protein
MEVLSPHNIIDMIKDAHVNNPYNDIKRNYLQSSEGSGLIGGSITKRVSDSRKKIVKLSSGLDWMSSFMVIYSMIYAGMKITDF